MKKDIFINVRDYLIHLVSNGANNFDNIVICFHGFNGDKWGDSYSGLKKILTHSLVVSFDSCGHGKSEILSEDMRLDLILEEIDVVYNFLKQEYNKPIIFVAVSYGAYRIMQYLIKYKPTIEKVVYINPAFNILKVLEKYREFNYLELHDNDKVSMKRSLNKFIKKPFLDDLYFNDLYSKVYDLDYNSSVVVGKGDTLIEIQDTLKIASMYNYPIIYVDDTHCLENKDNWKIVANIVEDIK